MADEIIDIPDHADKLLFAEDFVSHVLNNIFISPYYGQKAAPYRAFIYNAFNDNIRKAVCFLFPHVQRANAFYNWIEAIEVSDKNVYLSIAMGRRSQHLSEGFDITHFLYFSIEVAILARKFRNNGLLEAPDLAVKMISDSLPKGDMHSGVWDAVNVTASKFAKLFDDSRDIMTPTSFSPDMSDRENQIWFPQNSDSDRDSDMMTPISGSPVTSDSEIQSVSHQGSNSDKDSDMMTPISGSPEASDIEIDIMSHVCSSSDKDSDMMSPISVSPNMSENEIQYESYQCSNSDKDSDRSVHSDVEVDCISSEITGRENDMQPSEEEYAVSEGPQAKKFKLLHTSSGKNNLEHPSYHEPLENMTESSIKQEDEKNDEYVFRDIMVAQQDISGFSPEYKKGMQDGGSSSKHKKDELKNCTFRNEHNSSVDEKSSSKYFSDSSALIADEKEYIGSSDKYGTD